MKKYSLRIVMILVIALISGFLVPLTLGVTAPAEAAARTTDFDPGNIISDAKMYDGGAMSAREVQEFLDSKVQRCTIGDPGRKSGAEWGSTRIANACLKDYAVSTPSRAANNYCAAYQGSASETAAQIIVKVGQVCNISQKALLVLLEKEQSLVSDSWPTELQYLRAMGYACPDSGVNNSANCDATQQGFFHQVYRAAWQFQLYRSQPYNYNHIAGRVNNIRFHPDSSCGSSPVFIQNTATAGLYNYTPYQPNTAALNNLYGTGDSCSAYGNRNFWRMYSDWFGSPTDASSLVRTVANSTVYLVSGEQKYAISSLAVLEALSALGKVEYVSDQYLSRFATAHLATQVIRAPEGSMYFVGSGIKLPFTNCETVAHYGGSCGAAGFVQLDSLQVARFATGPVLSQLMGTTTGSRYFIQNGTKREILDVASQEAAGIGGSMNVLTDGAIASIPFGDPVARASVAVEVFGTQKIYLLDAHSQRWAVSAVNAREWNISKSVVGRLREESLTRLNPAPGEFLGVVQDGSGKLSGLASGTSRVAWEVQSWPESASIMSVSDEFLEAYPITDSVTVGDFVKAPNAGTIYLIADSMIRPIGSWETLISMSEEGNPHYSTVPQSLIDSMAHGPVALEAATLVRSNENATVFLVNGITNKIPISSFDPAAEAGLTRFSFTLQDRIAAYPTSEAVLEYGLSCDGTDYLAAGGSVRPLTPDLATDYPFTYLELDQYVCRLLQVGEPATEFIRTPSGSIYYVFDGQKHPITSMARYAQLDASNRGYMNVSGRFADMIETGPIA